MDEPQETLEHPAKNAGVVALRWCLIAVMGFIAFRHATDPRFRSIFSGIDLVIHEAGHLFFMWFGNTTLMIMGGTSFQILVPALIALAFRKQGDAFAVGVGVFWVGVSLAEVAPYAADAQAQLLPLVSPSPGQPIHDWNYLLTRFGLLENDHLVGKAFRDVGVLVMATGVFLSVKVLRKAKALAHQAAPALGILLLTLSACTPEADSRLQTDENEASQESVADAAPTDGETTEAASPNGSVRVVVPEGILAQADELLAQYPNLELVEYSEHREMVMATATADAVIGWEITPKTVRDADQLRWVHVLTGGVNSVLSIPEIRDNPAVTLTSMKIQKGPEVADHAMALLLGLTRNLPQFLRRMESQEWDGSSDLPVVELRGKTMLIVGLGGIGIQLAERAHASGMRVIGTDPKDLPFMGSIEYAGKPDELLALLPEADVVAVCAPLTPETEKILDERAFSAMKDGAYFVSVSRGELTDTDALVQALRSGKLVAAGLDVVDPEPLERGHPLWSMPNVILTPHLAGRSDGRVVRQDALILDNIERFMQGLPLKNTIDKQKGY